MRSLIKLGVSERLAISCASGFIKSTSRGPCRSSKTKGINIAISNAFLAGQDLQLINKCGLTFTIHNKMKSPVRMHMQGVGTGD